jgi:hypothetical protein
MLHLSDIEAARVSLPAPNAHPTDRIEIKVPILTTRRRKPIGWRTVTFIRKTIQVPNRLPVGSRLLACCIRNPHKVMAWTFKGEFYI